MTYYILGSQVLGPDGLIDRDLSDAAYRGYLSHINPSFDLRSALIEATTAKRWEVETGGITLSNGIKVGTTKADQDRITSVIANAENAGVTSVDFKASSGWVTLSLSEVKQIASAIALHVQQCFSAERAHHQAIQMLPEMALEKYDVGADWPTETEDIAPMPKPELA